MIIDSDHECVSSILIASIAYQLEILRGLFSKCCNSPSLYTSQGGKGLHAILGVHSKKFFGVLNGIDEEAWDPATDPLIDYQYSAEDIDGKYVNKQKLRERLGLASQGNDERRPLV